VETVGTLFYGAARTAIDLDDRVLAHIQIVVISKLRRRESFALTWSDGANVGYGRSTVWINPGTDLHFRFSGSRPPAIDRDWLETMVASANSANGLHIDEATLAEAPHPSSRGPQFD
jgi:hypothetical protein